MKALTLMLMMSPAILLAAPSGSGEYDIIPRTVNFIIFVAIMFYLLAKPIKNMYDTRIKKIATRLEDIQKRVLESKNKRLEAIKSLEDAKKEADNAIALAHKEAELMAKKIKSDAKNDMLILEKTYDEQQNYELRKMQKDVVSAALAQIFDDSSLKQDDIINIMLKKVS
ncbi:F0F1 ATP synthase subunit B [uncultured Campylobacter sp.]|uniref:F0F1 ATP synthase subunit B n=1 Tax=uncultured Campylobacter sp. TaxID=218934 RepID=UPI002616C294|nr:F0F1 ATP synthase subunit B [uncultured Campylobacter sp.]